MQKRVNILLLIVVSIILVVVNSSVYNVGATQQVIVTQFGNIVGEAVVEPGLHFKIPFIQKTHYLPQHVVHEWNSDPQQISTFDKTYLWVEIFVLWKISDPINYFQRIRYKVDVPGLYDDIMNPVVKDIISSHKLSEIIGEHNFKQDDFVISKKEINKKVVEMTRRRFDEAGIEIVTVEVKSKK